MIELHVLEQLAAFAEHGSLSKAAESLLISQPALSRSMKKLESDLGVSLFNRENSKISLNETGKLAARHAEAILIQSRDMENSILAFDRSLHSITLGSCAPYPITSLMPVLQNNFGGMTITSEINDVTSLIKGLKNNIYQLAVVNKPLDDSDIYCQRFFDEQLYITIPEDHPLSQRDGVYFSDLKTERLLLHAHVGFWLDICRKNIPEDNLLIQKDMNALIELVNETRLPFFNSDRVILSGLKLYGRVDLPIMDDIASAVYYIACPSSEKKKYSALFNSVRSEIISGS